MAENILQSRLTLRFVVGLDNDGNEKLASKSFSNINNTATNEQLNSTAQALASLQQHSLVAVVRSNLYEVMG